MFITNLITIQAIFFLISFLLERIFPNKQWQTQKGFSSMLCFLMSIGAIFAQIMFFGWINIAGIGIEINEDPLIEGIIFYLIYSLVNYWAHRAKHAMPTAWKYLHKMHHSTSHMDSRVAFYRHPLEMVVNTVILFALGKIILDVSVNAVAMALVIEGILETFHHANIKLPRWIRPLGYIIQIPEQHIIHHQKGLHKYNYSPLALWDLIFGTLRFHHSGFNGLGFKDSNKAWPYLRFDK